jgi:hypothetical protein
MTQELQNWENEGGAISEPSQLGQDEIAAQALKTLVADVTEDAREEDSPEVFA